MSFKLAFQQDKSAVLRFNSTTTGISEVLRMKAKSLKFTKDFKTVVLTLAGKLQIGSLEDSFTPIETSVTTDCYETSLASIYFSANDKLQIYNRSTGKISYSLDLPKITMIAVNQDDSRLGIIANHKIYIITLKTNSTTVLKLPTANPTSLSFYPFKKSVVLAGFEDGSVAMWDVNLSSSANTYKAMVHNAPVRAVSFAPCNKHFYCSAGMDGKLLFHDINARSGKGILQEYKADGPLMCLTINDDHTVAAGTDSGSILIYDLRLKKVICRHETESNLPITFVQWQPPKWALNAAMKDPVNDHIPEIVEEEEKRSSKEIIASVMGTSVTPPNPSVMDIFSPVNKSIIDLIDSMIKSATLGSFHEKLKNSVKHRSSSAVKPQAEAKDAVRGISRSISNSAINQTPDATSSIHCTPNASSMKTNLEITPIMRDYGVNSTSGLLNSLPNAIISDPPTTNPTPENFDSHNIDTPTGSSKPIIIAKDPEVETPKAIIAPKQKMPIGTKDIDTTEYYARSTYNTASKFKSESEGLIPNLTPNVTPTPNIPPSIPPTPLEKLHDYLDNPKLKQTIIKDDRIGGLVTDTLEIDVIRRVVDQVVQEHFVEIKNDIQQMHIEILREFQLQRMEIEEMVERHVPAAKLLELVERLTEENDRLKRTY